MFIVGLVLSGVTAFPLLPEVDLLVWWFYNTGSAATFPLLAQWVVTIQHALHDTQTHYPYLFYGTDWLAFGHIIIALFFLGPYRDPVRNVFILHVGVAACVLVFPLAFICGPIRGIPFFWQLIDCSFGALGVIPLLIVLKDVRKLEQITSK